MKQNTTQSPAPDAIQEGGYTKGKGELKSTAWGETITITNFEGDTFHINPYGDRDKGIPSLEDREIAARICEAWNNYDGLKAENEQLREVMRLTSGNLRDLAITLAAHPKDAIAACHDLADRLYNTAIQKHKQQ